MSFPFIRPFTKNHFFKGVSKMKKRRTVQSFLSGYFGVVIASGGIIGFLKASSFPSLIMGLSFGAIFVISGLLSRKFQKQTSWVNLYASLALASFFVFRYSIAWKFMPAGLMACLSTAMFIWSAYYLQKLKNMKISSAS